MFRHDTLFQEVQNSLNHTLQEAALLVTLYADPYGISFSEHPRLPTEVFAPHVHGDRKLLCRNGTALARDSSLWNILLGLHMMNTPTMALVSGFHSHNEGVWQYPQKIWVDITTKPASFNGDLIPVTSNEGKSTINHLWSSKGEMRTPFSRSATEYAVEEDTPEAWVDFFSTRFLETIARAEQNLADLTRTIETARHRVWLLSQLKTT